MPELKDLVQFSLDKQPSKFKDAFGELLANRVVDRVDELKSEISANMFGEAPVEDEDDIEDLDDSDEDIVFDDEDDVVDDEDLSDFDIDDEDMPADDEEIDFEDEDEDGIVDEDDDSFNEEIVNAIKEDTNNTHWIDSQETRSAKGGGITLGMRERASGKITGFVHVGPKVDSSGKKSMFGSHHKMTYAQIGRGRDLDGTNHNLGVRKFSQKDIESTVANIHANTGK